MIIQATFTMATRTDPELLHARSTSRPIIERKETHDELAIQTTLHGNLPVPSESPTTPETVDDVDFGTNYAGRGRITSLFPEESELSQPLQSPYKNIWYSKMHYYMKTFLVTHSRIYALYLLFLATWPRGLVLFDMYTDIRVAYNLYSDNTNANSFWFMLACLFIITPFLLVWVASLRFIQQWLTVNQSKYNLCIQILVNVALFLYIFPPIGMIVMFFIEIGWVFKDIIDGSKAFIKGTGIVESNEAQYVAMKV